MDRITDHFKVGDQIEWIHVKFLNGTYDVITHTGAIREIVGSTARIESSDFEQEVTKFLFELIVKGVSNE